MKTKPEFRKIALDFAKRNGFDNVHFHGMLGKVEEPGADIEVYTGGYKTPCVVGLHAGTVHLVHRSYAAIGKIHYPKIGMAVPDVEGAPLGNSQQQVAAVGRHTG